MSADSTETLKDELVGHLREDRQRLLPEWLHAVRANGDPWKGATTAQQESEGGRVYDICVDFLDTLTYQRARDFAQQLARQASQGAGSAEDVLSGVLALRDVYWRGLLTHYRDEPDRLDEILRVFEPRINNILVIAALAVSAERERAIGQQQEETGDLATPVLRIRDRLLLLPIIGLIDSDRALRVTKGLLEAIREFRARAVVMDITGVAAVDSKVANHLIQTVDAAKLLGATVVVTGVSPAIAQTIVTIGVDLSQIQTVGDLQGGLDLADRILGYRVVLEERGVIPVAPATVT